jgi:guanylate kinase
MRATDSAKVIEKRLEYAKKEMAQKDLYRHIIVNDNLSQAIDELSEIVKRYRQ